MYLWCVCAYAYCYRPRTMRWDFEGGVYWDEFAEICGEILRAAGFQGVARFWENTVIKMGVTLIKWVWPKIFRVQWILQPLRSKNPRSAPDIERLGIKNSVRKLSTSVIQTISLIRYVSIKAVAKGVRIIEVPLYCRHRLLRYYFSMWVEGAEIAI